MKKCVPIIILSAVLLLLCSASALALDIRVLLSSSSADLTFAVERGDYSLIDRTSNFPVDQCSQGDTITVSRQGGFMAVSINGVDQGSYTGPLVLKTTDTESLFRFKNTKYRGSFTITNSGSAMTAVNTLNIECYLYGVVGKEIGASAPAEALKAQAICSRSYAVANRKANSSYDVSATTSSQVYGGYTAELETNGEKVVDAVNATADQVLYYKNKVIPAYYSANAGGRTETIENVWGSSAQGAPFYSVASPEDSGTSSYSWTKTLTASELVGLANKYGNVDIGQFKEIRLSKTDPDGNPTASGRVYTLEIVGTNGTVTAKRDAIRTALGGLRSTLFSVSSGSGGEVYLKSTDTTTGDSDLDQLYVMGSDKVTRQLSEVEGNYYKVTKSGKQLISSGTSSETASGDTITLTGYGYGHGVGMSQHGAIAMAKNGATYEEIFARYFMNNGQDKNFYIGDI